MVKAGRKMLLQQRLAIAKMAHPRLASEEILAVGRRVIQTPLSIFHKCFSMCTQYTRCLNGPTAHACTAR